MHDVMHGAGFEVTCFVLERGPVSVSVSLSFCMFSSGVTAVCGENIGDFSECWQKIIALLFRANYCSMIISSTLGKEDCLVNILVKCWCLYSLLTAKTFYVTIRIHDWIMNKDHRESKVQASSLTCTPSRDRSQSTLAVCVSLSREAYQKLSVQFWLRIGDKSIHFLAHSSLDRKLIMVALYVMTIWGAALSKKWEE